MNDLYDRLRPADEPLDDVTADRIWARIAGQPDTDDRRNTEPHDDDSSDFDWDGAPPERQRSRRLAAVMATAAAVVGLAATALVVSHRDAVVAPSDSPDPISSPDPDQITENEANPVFSGQTSAAPIGPIDLAAGTDFAVADYVPAGWELTSMEASSSGSLFGSAQWALLGADGSVAGVVSIRAPRPISDEEAAQSASGDYDTTIRGVPASEYQQAAGNGNSESRTGIDWIEDSLQISLTATGDAEALARPVAEALVIDETTRSVSIPDSLGLVPSSELDFADPDAVNTTIGVSPATAGFGATIIARPNTFGYDLDRLVRSELDWQPTRIDDNDARVATMPGGGRQVAWLDNDMFVTVASTATISDDDLFNIIRGVRFTDAANFRQIGSEIATQENAEIAGWEVFDRTTTPDGFDVTVRSQPGSSGANAICVETPQPVCTKLLSESGAIDGFEKYGAAGFNADGATIGVAWVSNDLEIERSGQIQRPAESSAVSVRPSDFLNPADGYLDGTTATVIANVQTERGRFVVVDIPPGERPPTIRFSPTGELAASTDAADATSFELTPEITSPFSF